MPDDSRGSSIAISVFHNIALISWNAGRQDEDMYPLLYMKDNSMGDRQQLGEA